LRKKCLCDDLIDQKTAKVEGEQLALFKEVLNMYNQTYELHYSFDAKKLSHLFAERKRLIEKARELMKQRTSSTPLVVHHAMSMIQSMANVWSFELQLNWK